MHIANEISRYQLLKPRSKMKVLVCAELINYVVNAQAAANEQLKDSEIIYIKHKDSRSYYANEN